jgi:hypothetical protein
VIRGRRWLVAAALAVMCAVYLLVFRLEALAPLGPLRNLAATLLASGPFALAIWASQEDGDPGLPLLLLGTALLHLCVPLALLSGTDDAFRYLWDGRVLDHGINPYAHPPQSAALAALRETHFHPHIFRPDMRTVYPPLCELWFWVAYRLSSTSFVGLKIVLLIHQLAAAWILARLVASSHEGSALIYAWSPLAVVQLMAGGHLDGLMIPWLLLSLLLADRRPFWSGAALGGAAMVRPTAVLCAPALLARRPWRQAGVAALGGAVAVAGLLLPFARAGAGLYESLLAYARHWRFNGSLYRLVELLVGQGAGARIAAYGLIGAASLGGAWLGLGLPARFLIAVGAYLALAPTVYPWYMLPAAAVGALFGGPLAVLLPALASVSDLVYVERLATGEWQVPTLALVVEYGAIYALLIFELARRRLASGGAPRP